MYLIKTHAFKKQCLCFGYDGGSQIRSNIGIQHPCEDYLSAQAQRDLTVGCANGCHASDK